MYCYSHSDIRGVFTGPPTTPATGIAIGVAVVVVVVLIVLIVVVVVVMSKTLRKGSRDVEDVHKREEMADNSEKLYETIAETGQRQNPPVGSESGHDPVLYATCGNRHHLTSVLESKITADF